ncbi:DUF3240 family protein [Stenotrophomonas pictorum]|nr:DUF3240 family protein [Stenotrophomonas pictorum]
MPRVRLCLTFPRSLEATISDVLIAAPGLPGFTLISVEGHGGDFVNASTAERVRGRMDQRVLWMLVDQEKHQQVLALLRATVVSNLVHWWLEPVLDGGQLA